MEKTKDTRNIHERIATARKQMKHPARSKTNAYKKYKYATLQDLYDSCLFQLLEEGVKLAHNTIIIEKEIWLRTSLTNIFDKSDFDESFSKMKLDLDPQEYGALETYYKKYHISGMLCLRSDFDGDDDGESLKGKNIEEKKSQAANKFINKEQGDIIFAQLENDGVLYEKLKTAFGINSVKELTSVNYKNAISFINVQKQNNN